jgi:nucleoside-diphosphate-sugar epimerase
MTRSPGKQAELRALGATPALADVFDAEALRAAMRQARPEVVIHQLTALPKEGVKRASDIEATNRLRIEGTRNLLAAAIAAGARRFIGGSFALLPGAMSSPGSGDAAGEAVRSMESQILERAEAARSRIVLRYGLFYGPGNPSTVSMVRMVQRRRLPVVRGDHGQLPVIHLDDAVSATVAALDHGGVSAIYDIVDDRPVSMTDIVKAIAELAGRPGRSSCRRGCRN